MLLFYPLGCCYRWANFACNFSPSGRRSVLKLGDKTRPRKDLNVFTNPFLENVETVWTSCFPQFLMSSSKLRHVETAFCPRLTRWTPRVWTSSTVAIWASWMMWPATGPRPQKVRLHHEQWADLKLKQWDFTVKIG